MIETVVVPGRHEMMVSGKLKASDRGIQPIGISGVFEPKRSFTDGRGLLLAHSIAASKGREVPVRLINLTDQDVVLYKKHQSRLTLFSG